MFEIDYEVTLANLPSPLFSGVNRLAARNQMYVKQAGNAFAGHLHAIGWADASDAMVEMFDNTITPELVACFLESMDRIENVVATHGGLANDDDMSGVMQAIYGVRTASADYLLSCCNGTNN